MRVQFSPVGSHPDIRVLLCSGRYIVKQVALSLQSPDKALKVAEAGLAYA